MPPGAILHFHLSSLKRRQGGCSGSSSLKVKLVKTVGQVDPVMPVSIWSKSFEPRIWYDGERDTTYFLCMFIGSVSNGKK